MAYVATSATAMKRSVDDDSDEETRPNAKKMSAASSPASMQTDTYVSKEREEGDLPKISTFPSAPKSWEQRANGRSLSPIRPPSFTLGGSSRKGININHEKPPPPPKLKEGHVKTLSLKKIINMAHNYIIQWNCRGIRSNRDDTEWLISKYAPAAICLQETMLKPEHTPTFKHYSDYYKRNIQGHGGVCILVKNNFIHSQVHFQADLQAVAVCITINNKTYTVASVYVPPSGTLNELAFDRMIKSFSSRYLVLDFNGHSHLWGANQENERGKVEHLIDSHNLILLNDSVHTPFDTHHQTSSLLDLSLCHPSIYMDVACEVLSDRLGSDHHPIIITANTSDYPVPERVPKWNFKKAKWDAFQDQCITEITPDLFNDAEDKMAVFSSTLLDIAADNIPETSSFPTRKAKSWFDEDCQAAKKERNKANRLANKHPSAANSMRAQFKLEPKRYLNKRSVTHGKIMYLQ